MSETESTRELSLPKLRVIDSGMRLTSHFDPDIATSMVIDLAQKAPEVFSTLPQDVSALKIETNSQPTEIPRGKLQEEMYVETENPQVWSWGQVFAYQYSKAI